MHCIDDQIFYRLIPSIINCRKTRDSKIFLWSIQAWIWPLWQYTWNVFCEIEPNRISKQRCKISEWPAERSKNQLIARSLLLNPKRKALRLYWHTVQRLYWHPLCLLPINSALLVYVRWWDALLVKRHNKSTSRMWTHSSWGPTISFLWHFPSRFQINNQRPVNIWFQFIETFFQRELHSTEVWATCSNKR